MGDLNLSQVRKRLCDVIIMANVLNSINPIKFTFGLLFRLNLDEIRGAFNKFLDFFVQAFKIGVDS